MHILLHIVWDDSAEPLFKDIIFLRCSSTAASHVERERAGETQSSGEVQDKNVLVQEIFIDTSGERQTRERNREGEREMEPPTDEEMVGVRRAVAACSSEARRLVTDDMLAIPMVQHMLCSFLLDTSR